MNQFDIHAVISAALTRGLTHFKANLLNTSPEQADRLKPKHATILKTISESFAHIHIRTEAIQFFIDIFPILERWGYWANCLDIAEEALALDLPPHQQALLHANLGRIYHLNRNFKDSLHHLNLGLAIAQQHQLTTHFGLIHHRLMNAYLGREEHQKAKMHGLQALQHLTQTPSTTLAAVYNSLGLVCMDIGDLELAEKYFWDALVLWDNLKDYVNMARSYQNLGVLFSRQNNPADAKKCYESALQALGDSSSNLDKLKAMNGLGSVHYDLGEYDKAQAVFQQGVDELQNRAEWYHLRGSLTHNLGNTLLAQGNPQRARFYLEKALTDWLQANDDLQKGNTLGTIAEAYEKDELWETAVTTYDQAIKLLANFPDHTWAIQLTNDFCQAQKKCAEQLKHL